MCKSADPWCRSASRVVAGRRRMPSERIAKHLSERAPTSAGIPATLSLYQKYVRRNRPISGQKSRKYISSGGNRFNPDKNAFRPSLSGRNRFNPDKSPASPARTLSPEKKFVTREKSPQELTRQQEACRPKCPDNPLASKTPESAKPHPPAATSA